MNGCAFGFHKYGTWSPPERANVPDGYTVRYFRSSVVQHRTCERCGIVDVRELDADISVPVKQAVQAGKE